MPTSDVPRGAGEAKRRRKGVYYGINIYFEEDEEQPGRFFIVGETIGKKVKLPWTGPRPQLRLVRGEHDAEGDDPGPREPGDRVRNSEERDG